MEIPKSCDTFVVLPPLSQHGIVFGKNSDRPQGEYQEVIYVPASKSLDPVKCTYIEVEPCESTKAVILSKPFWMWGAEMGANECGVVIGNEAIFTRDNEGDHDPSIKRLLGMDLVRLGLERSNNATEALEVITKLLEKYGQGGPCSQSDPNFYYHNSFLIADPTTAWVLETSGKHWAAEQIVEGYRNISNILTITTKIDRCSDGLKEYALSKGLWQAGREFNFSEVFNDLEKKVGYDRYISGQNLLKKYTETKEFRENDMFKILRDTNSDICRPCTASFPTQGSQVSTLNSTKPCVHWFTATPDPTKSVFKPFIFTNNCVISKHTICLESDIPHTLYLLHEAAVKDGLKNHILLRTMETDCVNELENYLSNMKDEDLSEVDELLKDCVETEVKFYR